MNKLLIAYGLTKPQFAHLQAALPEEYELVIAACVTDLIVTNAVCVVINAANMCQNAFRVLLLYYMDMGNRLDETIVWLGETEATDLPCKAATGSAECLLSVLFSLPYLLGQSARCFFLRE